MKLRYQLKEIKYAFQLGLACEKVKNTIRDEAHIEYILHEYERHLDLRDKYIKFEVDNYRQTAEELEEKIDNSMTAQIKTTIQATPPVKASLQDYENITGRSYDLL